MYIFQDLVLPRSGCQLQHRGHLFYLSSWDQLQLVVGRVILVYLLTTLYFYFIFRCMEGPRGSARSSWESASKSAPSTSTKRGWWSRTCTASTWYGAAGDAGLIDVVRCRCNRMFVRWGCWLAMSCRRRTKTPPWFSTLKCLSPLISAVQACCSRHRPGYGFLLKVCLNVATRSIIFVSGFVVATSLSESGERSVES